MKKEVNYIITYYNKKSGKFFGYLDKSTSSITKKLEKAVSYSGSSFSLLLAESSLTTFFSWRTGEPAEYYNDLFDNCTKEEIGIKIIDYKLLIRKQKLIKIKNR